MGPDSRPDVLPQIAVRQEGAPYVPFCNARHNVGVVSVDGNVPSCSIIHLDNSYHLRPGGGLGGPPQGPVRGPAPPCRGNLHPTPATSSQHGVLGVRSPIAIRAIDPWAQTRVGRSLDPLNRTVRNRGCTRSHALGTMLLVQKHANALHPAMASGTKCSDSLTAALSMDWFYSQSQIL